MSVQCRRLYRITRMESSLLSSLERSYLDTSKPFTASQAITAIGLTGNKKGMSFNVKLNSSKLCRIFRKSEDYEVFKKVTRGKTWWIKNKMEE